jgi:hypothetical protein
VNDTYVRSDKANAPIFFYTGNEGKQEAHQIPNGPVDVV